MNALATTYNKQQFRSRLEARWAFFLDAMSIAWQYEKEAFDMGGLTYVPDFFLGFAWLETKGELITDEIGLQVIRKCTRLAVLSHTPVILAFNDPLDQRCAVFGKRGGFYTQSHFTVCRICGTFGVKVRVGEDTCMICPRGKGCEAVEPTLIRQSRRQAFDAAMAARKHRFSISRKSIC